ncbi:putative metal-binding motif-containing protein, partial [Nanoarchaeota archaeon]
MKKEVLILVLLFVLPMAVAQVCDYDPLCPQLSESCGCEGVKTRVTACEGGCGPWQGCSMPETESSCIDGVDNECDGFTDCQDIECSGNPLCIDEDNDGYSKVEDCIDTNPSVNPGAEEICDSIDNNCN